MVTPSMPTLCFTKIQVNCISQTYIFHTNKFLLHYLILTRVTCPANPTTLHLSTQTQLQHANYNFSCP